MKTNILETIKIGIAAFITMMLLFVLMEPVIGTVEAADSQFTISQTITKEIAFVSPATNVVMSPSLGGITGGNATGTVQVAVATNSLTGYTMTITASSSNGMQGQASSTNYIPAYVTAGNNGTPDWDFTVGANKAYFGYTVEATTSTDVAQTFRNSGTTCNSGSNHTGGAHCWLAATTSAVTIINRSTPTAYTGASTTISFHVGIASNPNPMIPNDVYLATTTLTATAN